MNQLSVALSAAFALWLSVCVVVGALRCIALLPRYRRWKLLDEAERRTLVMIPCLCGLAYWSDYQRINYLANVLRHDWLPVFDPVSVSHLLIGTTGVAGVMWVMLCALFGEREGHTTWIKLLILGVASGVVSVGSMGA